MSLVTQVRDEVSRAVQEPGDALYRAGAVEIESGSADQVDAFVQDGHRPVNVSLYRTPKKMKVWCTCRPFDESGAFVDSAAIMQGLDLIICSDTALPHLAGAVGVPVWLALPLVPDWRWLLVREDCPWYPSMRLFRQGPEDSWDDVFERMADELRQLVAWRQSESEA